MDEAPAPAAVDAKTVLDTLRAAMSHVKEQREPAEAALRGWEADAAPGFLQALMMIVQEQAQIDEVRRAEASRGACRTWRRLCFAWQGSAWAQAHASSCSSSGGSKRGGSKLPPCGAAEV